MISLGPGAGRGSSREGYNVILSQDEIILNASRFGRRCRLISSAMIALVIGLAITSATVLLSATTASSKRADFDVFIVGAGPAGSAVAHHLEALSDAKVLVLEAGGASQRATGGQDYLYENLTIFDVPLAWSYVAKLKQYHWQYHGDSILAKAVGGCGVHNAMLYIRSLPEDIAGWNLSEWTWKDIQEQYLALEDFQGPPLPFHGARGPIATSLPVFSDLLGQKFLETTSRVGIPTTLDFNAPGARAGAGPYHFNIRAGVRDGAAAALLMPALSSGQVTLQPHTSVTELVLDEAPHGDGLLHRVRELRGVDGQGGAWTLAVPRGARVVLTAGAISTPALLLKSFHGKGRSLRGETVLPAVGRFTQDHPAVGMYFDVNPQINADMASTYSLFKNWTESKSLDNFPESFGYPGFSTGAFLFSGVADPSEDSSEDSAGTAPDLQLTVFPVMIEPHLSKRMIQVDWKRVLVTIANVRPKTTFRVRLSGRHDAESSSGSAEGAPDGADGGPEIFYDSLHPVDVRRLASGVRKVRQIFGADPLKTFVIGESVPGPSVETDDDLEQWVTREHTSNSHWCCSARMGLDPGTSVVDGGLKVHGFDNLFVADASVFPSIPNGNVHSTVVAVASLFGRRLAKMINDERAPH